MIMHYIIDSDQQWRLDTLTNNMCGYMPDIHSEHFRYNLHKVEREHLA